MASEFEIDRSSVLQTLSRHIGKASGITAKALVADITWQGASDAECRRLRQVIESLRREGQHICGQPKTGYFIAESEGELNESCLFLYRRAMTSLSQISAMKRISLPDIAGQLKLRI